MAETLRDTNPTSRRKSTAQNRANCRENLGKKFTAPDTRAVIRTGKKFLGIAGDRTRTVALLADADGRVVHRFVVGPANCGALTDAALLALLRKIARGFSAMPACLAPAAIAIGLADARDKTQCQRLRTAASRVWPGIPCHVTNDLETALAAAEPARRGSRSRAAAQARVLVVSGTGSCFYARAHDGRTAQFGGWGHILGDKGSGYEIGLRALKAVVYYLDRNATWSRLGKNLLRVLHLKKPADLIAWAETVTQHDLAALAPVVFGAARERDEIARDILEGAAHSLAKDACACAKKLVPAGAPADFVLAGGVLLNQPKFARHVAREIRAAWPGARVTSLTREPVWGAVALAQQMMSTNKALTRAAS